MPGRKMFKIIPLLLLISNINYRIHSLFISKLSMRLSYAWAINIAFSQVPATLLIGILFTPTGFDRKHCRLCQEYIRTGWHPWNKCCLTYIASDLDLQSVYSRPCNNLFGYTAARERVTYNAAQQRFQLNHFNGNISHAAKNPLQRPQAMPCLRKVDLLFFKVGW